MKNISYFLTVNRAFGTIRLECVVIIDNTELDLHRLGKKNKKYLHSKTGSSLSIGAIDPFRVHKGGSLRVATCTSQTVTRAQGGKGGTVEGGRERERLM